MSFNCTCGVTALGNMGRPGCVYTMAAPAFFVVFPRYNEAGTRQTIALNDPDLGANILGQTQTETNIFRTYPMPRMKNIVISRSETQYETASDQSRFRLDGVGGVYTIAGELWDKDAVNGILREAEKLGCTELDFYIVDKNGVMWVKKTSPDSNIGYGLKMDSGTFDAYKMFATDTSVDKIMISFDIDRLDKVSTLYPITTEELGYNAADELRGLVAGFQTASALTLTTLRSIVYSGFGSAVETDKIKGLLVANFKVYNDTDDLTVTPSAVTETSDGTYTITIAGQTAGDDLYVRVSDAFGYDVAESNKVEAL